MPTIPLTEIEKARKTIQPYIIKTPTIKFDYLSQVTNKNILLKCESLQKTGSFKIRGAANFISENLSTAKKSGVIAASAGNHAQGVAAISHALGIKASIVMPVPTPAIKVHNTQRWQAEVILHGDYYDESYEHAIQLAKEKGYVFVHPFNDKKIMAGQGTVILELNEDPLFAECEAVVIAVGGGGLISGCGSALRSLHPRMKVYGVTAQNAPGTFESFQKKKASEAPVKFTLAEGVAAKRCEEFTLGYLLDTVDEMVSVNEESIAHAISILAEQAKLVVEGAGALTIAAVLGGQIKEKNIALVISGGNIDLPVLSQVLQHGLVQQGRLVRLTVTLPDRPGSLHSVTQVFADKRANIIQIFHQRNSLRTPVGQTEIEVDLEIKGKAHLEEIRKAFSDKGYSVEQA